MTFNKKEDGYNVSESGNWNVASDYSRIKIMKPLDFCDHYENIARFGYDTLLEQLENFGIPLDTLKLIGFERLVNELIKLCGNSKFAMKSTGSKAQLEAEEKKLFDMRKVIPLLSKVVTKHRKQEVFIIKEKYYPALDLVVEIKAKLNEPLNKNDLIFTHKEDFDPKKYKQTIMEDAKSRG